MKSIICGSCRELNNPKFKQCHKCKEPLMGKLPGTGATYKCVKCGYGEYECGEMRVAGGLLGKLFDVEGRRFTSISCKKCTHTEFFKMPSSMIGNLFDLIAN